MNLISLQNLSTTDVMEIVEGSLAIKNNPERYANILSGRSLALLFQKTSTRTRCAGEIGMTQLGGHAVYLDWRTTNFGLADLRDEIRVLSSYVDVILARFLKHADIVRAAESATVPVINGCCDLYHPTQALGDLMTIQEKFGRIEGVKLTYVGMHNNVCNSLIAAGLKGGMEVTVVAPETNPASIDAKLFEAAEQAGVYKVSDQLQDAIAKSDVVYTDTWIDMEFFMDTAFEAEKKRRMKVFAPYQLNKEVLAGHDVVVMHCLPAHRGYEVSGEIVEDPRSIMFEQAENRLHSMKGLILKLLGKL
ncbi:MAG: ornithine carbamoyltransferase [Candidatus Poribacteria bacterium]|nr:ornithine carbamoyltransferase [Candidatus Poribacteria bacterium]